MKRKGISPLIAAVLLIAFTMAVASIFAQWAPQLMEDAQGDTSQAAQNIQDCSDRTMDVQVDSASAGTTPTAFIEQTSGDEAIGNLTVTWYWENSNPTQKSDKSIDSNRGIANVDGSLTEAVDEVQVRATECNAAPAVQWTPSN